MSGWTDERTDQAKALLLEGYTFRQIAKALGGVTRNAVLGKMHRMGIVSPHAQGTRADLPRKAKAPKPERTRPVPVREEVDLSVYDAPVTLDDGSPVTVLTVNDRMCRWPIGDPAEWNFHFCGHKPKSGSPYCEAHARRAYDRGENAGGPRKARNGAGPRKPWDSL